MATETAKMATETAKTATETAKMETEKAEQIRLKYLYRSLAIRDKLNISYQVAVKLVGPDCAYHLYPTIKIRKEGNKEENEKKD